MVDDFFRSVDWYLTIPLDTGSRFSCWLYLDWLGFSICLLEYVLILLESRLVKDFRFLKEFFSSYVLVFFCFWAERDTDLLELFLASYGLTSAFS